MKIFWVLMFWMAKPGACRTAAPGPFGSNTSPNSERKREATSRLLCTASALPDSKITHGPQYPISAAVRTEVVADLEKWQIISRTHSPSNSLVCPVRKPDGRWWLTIGYQRLNADTAPLMAVAPNIATWTATLQDAVHPWMPCWVQNICSLWSPCRRRIKKIFAFTWEGMQYTFNRLLTEI